MKQWIAPVAVAALVTSALSGAAAPVDDYRSHLYAGDLAQAATQAHAWVASAPESGAARFALGTAQFLSAVENLGHGLYRHGLRSQYDMNQFGGLTGAPFLRLPVPDNPAPQPVSYAALNGLLIRFADDLAVAEATLAQVGSAPYQLSLDLGQIGFDFDRDGASTAQEALLSVFRATAGRVEVPEEFMVDLDESDAPWLQGYCHLLMAMANFPAAHDWSNAFDHTFHAVFPQTDLPSSDLFHEVQTVLSELEKFRNERGVLPQFPARPRDMPWDDWMNSPEYQRYQAFSRMQDALEYGMIADWIAFVHLFNWPVTDPDRMASVRVHLLDMVRLSRENWRRIRAETDDSREWVPGPHQSGILPRMRVDDTRVKGWMMFLDEFESILTGDKLIPHWRFATRGINLKRMFEDPRPFDPVLIAQGSAVIPYLDSGETITGDRVAEIFDLFEGGFFAYFVFFN